MKFTNYIADRRLSIFCYVIFMIFISLVIYLDSSIKVGLGNVLYINLVSSTFFIIYLIIRYFYYRNYYSVLTDIVENKRNEIISRLPTPRDYEKILFHNVLLSLYKEESAKVQRLYEQKKDYEEFITSWVHQVKTPVSVSRLLIENNTSTPNEETLYSLEEELDKIENYIEQALYFSKIDDFSKDYLINEVSVDRLVKEVVKKHAKTFISKKINIAFDSTDIEVLTDKKWFTFILDQVLSNALKYTSSNGRIRIYGLNEDKVQKLIIEDNGIGIKSEDLDRVFDKGFTGFNGRESYKATGIGLYLSKKMARKLGHDISIASKYGEYTRVTISLPKLLDYLQDSKV